MGWRRPRCRIPGRSRTPQGREPGGRRLAVRGRGIRPVAAIGPGARLLAIPVSLVTMLGGGRVPAILVPLARLRRLGLRRIPGIRIVLYLVGVGLVGVAPGRRTGAAWRTPPDPRTGPGRAGGTPGRGTEPARRTLGPAPGTGVLLRVAGLVAVAAAGRQRPRSGAAEHHRAGRVVGAQGAEITGHRAGEISLTADFATAPITRQRGEPRVGRGTGKLARETARVPRVGVRGTCRVAERRSVGAVPLGAAGTYRCRCLPARC